MAALFDVIAANHQVTREQVRWSVLHRRMRDDLGVFLSFGALYGILAYGVARRAHRRFPLEEGRAAALTVILVVSFLISAGGVMVGEVWAITVESLRIGTGHLSYRTSRIPWVQHKAELWVAGVLMFWSIAIYRYRISRYEARIPEPPTSLLHLDG